MWGWKIIYLNRWKNLFAKEGFFMEKNVRPVSIPTTLPNLHELQKTQSSSAPAAPVAAAEIKTDVAQPQVQDSVLISQPAPEQLMKNAVQVGAQAQIRPECKPKPAKPEKPSVSDRISRAFKGALLTGLPAAAIGGGVGMLAGMWGGPGMMIAGGLTGALAGGLGGATAGALVGGMDNAPPGASGWDRGFGGAPLCGGVPYCGGLVPSYGMFPPVMLPPMFGLPFGFGLGFGFPMMPPLMGGIFMPFPLMGGFGIPGMGLPMGMGFFNPRPFATAAMGGMMGTLGGGLLGAGLGSLTGSPWGTMLGAGLGMGLGNMIGTSAGWNYGMATSFPHYGFPGMMF
jgi:hypothetical protein